ncbi:uncharacterized protein LOC109821886 [Asparagus officinalis]|uniref:uncharacterized protein LOC109821886 n=1 Tax=Asparagus officinalis TaxID=4686 RepID=UPI00098DEE6A|nr:uncharacterized protein LOC109821886 [Asparagus officinalis]
MMLNHSVCASSLNLGLSFLYRSVLVLNGNGAEVAKHCVPAIPTKRLGLKVASGFCEGIRVQEAKKEAFNVKDNRGELYKKHYTPALKDEVWRLEKIRKDGSFHKRLNKSGILTRCILDIDVQGARSMRAGSLEVILVFICHPSFDELEKHLRSRGTETE